MASSDSASSYAGTPGLLKGLPFSLLSTRIVLPLLRSHPLTLQSGCCYHHPDYCSWSLLTVDSTYNPPPPPSSPPTKILPILQAQFNSLMDSEMNSDPSQWMFSKLHTQCYSYCYFDPRLYRSLVDRLLPRGRAHAPELSLSSPTEPCRSSLRLRLHLLECLPRSSMLQKLSDKDLNEEHDGLAERPSKRKSDQMQASVGDGPWAGPPSAEACGLTPRTIFQQHRSSQSGGPSEPPSQTPGGLAPSRQAAQEQLAWQHRAADASLKGARRKGSKTFLSTGMKSGGSRHSQTHHDRENTVEGEALSLVWMAHQLSREDLPGEYGIKRVGQPIFLRPFHHVQALWVLHISSLTPLVEDGCPIPFDPRDGLSCRQAGVTFLGLLTIDRQLINNAGIRTPAFSDSGQL
ncbi:uncharacterized protein WM277_001961 [Molossus nigricans]